MTLSRLPARLVAIVASLRSLLVVPSAFAWSHEGHRVIGTIASANFDEATAKAVRELLGDQSVADACCWADDVRSDHRYDWIKPLHYINVPRGAERVDLKRDGLDGQQAVSAILKYRDVLKDPEASKEERVLALRLVLHLVGDVHQPLHVSFRDDLGGNKLRLKAFGRDSTLHRAWDTDLVRRRLRDTSGGWPVLSADLREAITPEQRAKWSKSRDPVAWANESLAITRRIYASMPKAPGDVDDSYYAKWMPTVNERLQAAGIRRAVLLNDAFATSEKSGATSGSKDAARKDKADEPSKDPGASAYPTRPLDEGGDTTPGASAAPPARETPRSAPISARERNRTGSPEGGTPASHRL